LPAYFFLLYVFQYLAKPSCCGSSHRSFSLVLWTGHNILGTRSVSILRWKSGKAPAQLRLLEGNIVTVINSL
jgi:hypothetical protein